MGKILGMVLMVMGAVVLGNLLNLAKLPVTQNNVIAAVTAVALIAVGSFIMGRL